MGYNHSVIIKKLTAVSFTAELDVKICDESVLGQLTIVIN